MFENKKAHYNYLHFNAVEQPTEATWETQNYRALKTNELISQLQEILPQISSVEKFERAAEPFASPEEMAEALCPKKTKQQDLLFLLIFELWRRQIPEKRAVSIFCDELDYQIASYYCQEEESEEVLDTIEYLQQILDDNADSGVVAADILPTLQDACCHEIESFLYDYTLAQIEEHQYDLAAELIEGFYSYLTCPIWFDYLIARLEMTHEPKQGHHLLFNLIERIEDERLALEILDFLAQTADPLFTTLLHHTIPLLKTEGDFLMLVACCGCYTEDASFEQMIDNRSTKDFEEPISQKDKDLKKIKEFFSDKS